MHPSHELFIAAKVSIASVYKANSRSEKGTQLEM
jgi:hypothetical protein